VIHVLYRQIRASLRKSRLQSVLVFITLVSAAIAITMAIVLWQRSASPWEKRFEESNAPHMVFYAMTSEIDPSALQSLPGITAVTAPVPMTSAYTLSNDGSSLEIVGLSADPDPVAKPIVTSGRWLTGDDINGIVLDTSYARVNGFSVGDTIEIAGVGGPERFTVVGLSATLWRSPYPEVESPVTYVLPETVDRLLDGNPARSIIMVRLSDPDAAEALTDVAVSLLPAGSICCINTWLNVRKDIDDITAINLGLLSVLSVLALIAAGFVIAGTFAGRVAERSRSFGLRKAIGETPGTITLGIVLEQLVLALPAGLIGFFIGIRSSRIFLWRGADPYGVSSAVQGYLSWLPLFLIFYLGIVVLFALLPAWRGGRSETTQALRPVRGSTALAPSWSERVAARLRLPLPVRLGLKDLFTHPTRSLLMSFSVAMIVASLVIAISAERTLAGYRTGAIWAENPPELRVSTGPNSPEDAAQIVANTPGVATSYDERLLRASINSSGVTYPLRAVSGDVDSLGLRIVEGRMFNAPGEIVAGQGLLDATGLRIGDSFTVTIGSQTLTLHLVGRYVEFEGDGEWGMLDRATFASILPDLTPNTWYLQLTPGADLADVRADLVTRSNGQLFVKEITPDASRRDVFEIRVAIYSVAAILAVIGAIHIVTTSMLDLRERTREIGVLQALGLTAREIATGIFARVIVLALLGVGFGIAIGWIAGTRVYDHFAVSDGLGHGLAEHLTWVHFALLIPAILLFAALSAAAPIARSLRHTPAEALRYE
jgi:putative ABC transport system permease protein